MTTDPKDDALVELAAELTATVIPLSRALRATSGDLTPTQRSVLGTILRHQPITMGQLAEEERLSPAMISRVVSALVDRGLADRLPDERDRRICHVRLSDAGLRWVEDSRVKRNQWLADRLADLDADQRATIAAATPLLDRLVDEHGT